MCVREKECVCERERIKNKSDTYMYILCLDLVFQTSPIAVASNGSLQSYMFGLLSGYELACVT